MVYQHRREPLTIKEREHLVNACRTHREKLCVYVLLDTGLRVSELANLEPECIRENQIAFYKKVGSHKKKLRLVPLTERCKRVLETHFNLGDGINLSIRTVQRLVAKVGVSAGISKKVSPQLLRKTFMVKILRRGMSIPTIERLLDKRLMVTDLYPEDPQGEEALKEFFSKW